MKLERVPRDRAEGNIERFQTEKSYWQEVGRRVNSLRESSRQLFSFQNPFSDRIVRSNDEMVLTATARRDTIEQERSFTVKQTAQADRFLSTALEENHRIESGTYTFSVGNEQISFEFRGGSLKDFTEALNRRSRDLLRSSLVTVKPGTTSLLIESRITGEENRLGFSGAAASLGESIGMIGLVNDSYRNITSDPIKVDAGSSSEIAMNFDLSSTGNRSIKFEISTELRPETAPSVPTPPPGPSIPSAGSISYGGIVIENENSTVTLPQWTAPEPPKRIDDMAFLSLKFSDGGSVELPPISDSRTFNTYEYNLNDFAGGKNIVSMDLINKNTHRDVSIRNVQVFDPSAPGGVKPLNAVSTARDAIVSMEGIEVRRSSNEISDLIPGVTITARSASDRPVMLTIEPDREAVKESIISFVGNYNRLVAEINVLTRNDSRVIDELSYLSKDEREEYTKKLGSFSGDSSLMQMRSSLMRIVNSPYETSEEQNLALLSQIGIGTDVRRSGGTDVSRLRGYLEIDEKALDAAIASKLPAIKQLFSNDTTGDMLPDTGIAYSVDVLTRPYTEMGGFIAQKTGGIDSRIAQETQRIENLDRQLARKEADLKRQYGQMEGAYNRMEQMSTSLDRFQTQNNNNNNR